MLNGNSKDLSPWLLLFVALALIIYLPAHGAGWVLDDRVNLVDNPLLADPLAALRGHRGVSFFSFAIDNWLWGSNPVWSRWVNVAIHLLNSLLVMALVRRLAGVGTRWAALLGLLFLCHPVQTATVNYVIQRMALLSACFALLSILSLDCYFERVGQGKKRAALVFCALSVWCGLLSIMAKENTALLPLAVPLVAWLRGRGRLVSGWKPVLAVWALLIIGALMIMARGMNLDSGATYYQDIGEGLYRAALDDRSWLPLRYLLSQFEVFWVYLGVIFLPLTIGFDYGWPIPPLAFNPRHILTAGLLLGGMAASFRYRQRYPLTFFGLIWVALFMGVESSVIPLDPIFLHRLYLALAGIVLIVYEQFLARLREPRGKVCAVLVLAVWAGLAAGKSSEWRDPVTFWSASSKASEKGLRTNIRLAQALFAQGRYPEAADLLVKRTEGGTQLPNLVLTGEALFFAGRQTEALTVFRKVALMEPVYSNEELFQSLRALEAGNLVEADRWLDLAERKNRQTVLGLYLRGRVAEHRQQYIPAAQFYRNAVDLSERLHAVINFDSTYAVWAETRLAELQALLMKSLERERAAVSSEPNDYNRRGELANLLLTLGRVDEAIEQYRQLKAVAPPSWFLSYNLGIAYEKAREYQFAVQSYREGLALSPEQPLLLYNFALLEKRSGRLASAREAFEQLLRVTPSDGRAWISYADLLWALGQGEKAMDALRRALNLPGVQREARQLLYERGQPQ